VDRLPVRTFFDTRRLSSMTRFTSNKSLQLTAGRRESSARSYESVLDVSNARLRQR
jgi:hypothetical protein